MSIARLARSARGHPGRWSGCTLYWPPSMTRRFAAIVALLAVVVTPLGALWCAYTCATDDDGVASARVSQPIATISSLDAGGPDAAVAAHDECAADLTTRALRAVLKERIHTVPRLAARSTAPIARSGAGGLAGLRRRQPRASWSPPGARPSTVLRL
jgi:hypothetical protein